MPNTWWPAGSLSLLWRLKRRQLTASKAPILVGPFRGEVGFEALYWQPFVAKLGLPRERLFIVSCGGTHQWYASDHGVDIYAWRTAQDVRVQNRLQTQQTGMLKQRAWTDWDRQVMREAATRFDLRRYVTLHPSWMYRVLAPYWLGHRGLEWLKDYLRMDPLPVLPLPAELALPEKFVAARFYYRYTWPRQPLTVEYARVCLEQLSQQIPVVLLNTGLHVDEHIDFDCKGGRVLRLSDLMAFTRAENGLAIQSAVLARSEGFVGTYGGLSQLALRYRKASLSHYLQWGGTAIAHKHLADAISLETGVPHLVVHPHEVPMLRSTLPPVTVRPAVPAPQTTGVTRQPVV